jgi:cell filamentation protein
MVDRYETTGSSEGRFQPGSINQVLINKLGITNPDEMDEVESDQQLTAADLCDWHRTWLEEVYSWVGEYRSVNMQKGKFMFAAAHLINRLMAEFERDFLSGYTPCEDYDEAA